MTNVGTESMPVEIMVIQASGIVIETLLFVAKEVPIIKSFAHVLQGTLKVIRQAIINEESILTLHDCTVDISNDLLEHFIKQAKKPKFKNAVQRFKQTLHQISEFISTHKKSLFKKIVGAKDSKLVTKVESYIQKLRDVESRMQTLYSIEVDEKIDQIRALLTITTNNTDGSTKVSEDTENTYSEDNTEVYDVNLTVDGAGNEIIEEDSECLEKDTEIIEDDNETNEDDDEGNRGVTLDQILSIKTATRFDTNG